MRVAACEVVCSLPATPDKQLIHLIPLLVLLIQDKNTQVKMAAEGAMHHLLPTADKFKVSEYTGRHT